MSMQNKLKEIQTALLTVSKKTYHYFRPAKTKAPYIVWAEADETDSVEADNHKAAQAVEVIVDYFTAKEFDPTVDQIQDALNETTAYFNLQSVQYGDPENDNDNLIHYQWSCKVVGG